ncbi:imidazole glycerol phosphate synthase subunit HisH [Hyphomicrobium methylovorum]|uniref:imidazole glycerol phosphate synthase subunit HisH n=1 Tax=Hyphomicrobium methylovorum TaxID=84 RepID=UPI0015E7BA04|nr:imidazole glycerol phosphate synthase subunit HisH [Hyphomicrobium methylovorum]MBA2126203.1 imidazole glycerol phosphate synthase subunit HisH [Hyphomicrobium methylovorum]
MQNVVIIDYGSGNLHSAAKAFESAARESEIASNIVVSSRAEDVLRADRVVLPGVGAYADCKRGLERVPGMIAALEETVRQNGRPFLGICVGMQLLSERGREFAVTDGLGWIKGEVRAIEPSDPALKIPHMGWNTLAVEHEHALLDGIPTGRDGWHAYFVHSFQLAPTDRRVVVADTDYGGAITALVADGNIAGTQFHPEKSQKLGLKLIANFLNWKP